MEKIIIFFYIMSFTLVCLIGIFLFKKLPNKNERLKLLIPVLAAVAISIVFYFFGWKVPRCSFGRFM